MIESPESSPEISPEEIAAATRVLSSPSLSMGPYIKAFENSFANYIGADHAVAVNSEASGLHLCIIGAGVKPGDCVIATPFSSVASSNCILYERGIPVFVDVDPQTGNIDPALVEEALGGLVRKDKSFLKRIPALANGYGGKGHGRPGRVKAILPVHVCGQPPDMDPIARMARKYEIPVIEDACEAAGATYKGRNAGAFGEYAVFAFHSNNQATAAEGGMIVCREAAKAELFRSLRNQGGGALNLSRSHNRPGFSYQMDEIRAALCLIQLQQIEEALQKRALVASWYNERLSGMELVRTPFVAASTTRMSWPVYVAQILPPASRDGVIKALGERGAACRPYFTPIHLQTFYASALGYRRSDFPAAERLGSISLALPFSSVMTESQVDQVCDSLRQILKYPFVIAPRIQGAPRSEKKNTGPPPRKSLRSAAARALLQSAAARKTARVGIDALIVALSVILSCAIRFDGAIPKNFLKPLAFVASSCVVFYLLANFAMRIYGSIWRFVGPRDALRLGFSVLAASIATWIHQSAFPWSAAFQIPTGALLMQPFLAFSGFMGARFLRRLHINRRAILSRSKKAGPAPVKRVLLAGAGSCAWMLVGELRCRPNVEIVGFLDDDPEKMGTKIFDMPVLGGTKDLQAVVRRRPVDEVVITMPSAPREVIRQLAADCEAAQVNVSAIPDVTEIALGRLKIDQARPLRLEDLLGRSRIVSKANTEEIRQCYAGKRILVTGGAGSIGSELVRQIARLKPERLLMLDKDENSLYETCLQVREEFRGEIVPLIANIRDRSRLERVLGECRPQAIFHAAAYKHVPMMEMAPEEAVINNIVGSRNVIELANQFGVERFVMISTDKAVNPTSVMGAANRVAEILARREALSSEKTRFCCVRFGNLLGSRASVVTLFERQIAQRKNILVTHPDVKRYFMTIPEAVHLVLEAGTLATAGETFVLDMGDPVKIMDLAKEMIERSGLALGKDIHIDITGLRPGEKLFEEMFYREEQGCCHTKYPKIFAAQPIDVNLFRFETQLLKLERAAQEGNRAEIFKCLLAMEINYKRAGAASSGPPTPATS